MNKRTVIVSGGMLEEEFVLDILKESRTDYIIGVDRGLAFLYEHHITPDYIVGDFDSLSEEILQYYQAKKTIPIRAFDPVKDATDTEIAIRLAIELEKKEVLILGATGGRIDHLWANVQVLKVGYDAGLKIYIMDSRNKIYLISGKASLEKEKAFGKYFSVFPLGGIVEDFNIAGARYPLSHHTLTPYDSLSVSNQCLEDKVEIRFPRGFVIMMETRD